MLPVCTLLYSKFNSLFSFRSASLSTDVDSEDFLPIAVPVISHDIRAPDYFITSSFNLSKVVVVIERLNLGVGC